MKFNKHLKVVLVFAGSLPFLILIPPVGPAQSLGEVATQYRKELQAREKKGEFPVKLLTNDDIARKFPAGKSESAKQAGSISGAPQAGTPKPSEPATVEPSSGSSSQVLSKARSRMKSKRYWQVRFKAARAALSHAKVEENLVADELRLLQIQQARELNPNRSSQLNKEIDSKTNELKVKRAATKKAQTELEKTEKEFKESGAPPGWSTSEKNSEQVITNVHR